MRVFLRGGSVVGRFEALVSIVYVFGSLDFDFCCFWSVDFDFCCFGSLNFDFCFCWKLGL